jgi:putative phosphoesterase
MILAVFSDIHGNIYALEKALKLIETYKVDKYLFLGDMAGYYYNQNECIELLSSIKNLTSLIGNHDKYFLDALSDEEYLNLLSNKYGKSYQILKENVNAKSVKFFKNLQMNEKTSFYEAYHANPNDNLEEYIYKNSLVDFLINTPILFLGHTHYEMQRDYHDTKIINPGSIGQPRDYNQASFSIVDVKNIKVENIRYTYNTSHLENKIAKLNDKKYLSDVLKRVKK